jgi:RHS repeat-associated protein
MPNFWRQDTHLFANAYRNLICDYDKAGNRTKIAGSFARTGIPQSVSSTNYNAANHQTTFGNKTLTYDNNGNLTSIVDASGTTLYTWNARNQLTGISGPNVSASFVYDGLGRREKKTINGSLTEFLFDGVNPVQETSGATILANVLPGLGIDEFFTRTDVPAAATSHFLPDGLGSTLALADSSGTLQTDYTYEPFGKTTATGATNTNPLQYTGRENDGTGLYYYRARYYQPQLQRFMREDPIEFAGGDINLYSCVGNNPLKFVDPFGLEKCQKSFLRRAWENFKLTNEVIPGLYAPIGAGLFSAGYTANALDTITLLGWARAGFRGATLAGATFTGTGNRNNRAWHSGSKFWGGVNRVGGRCCNWVNNRRRPNASDLRLDSGMLRFIIRRPQGRKPFSYSVFLIIQICFWLYAVGWFSLLTWIYLFWDASLYYKLGVSILVALLTPDAHSLFQSYERYKDEWKRNNPAQPIKQPS